MISKQIQEHTELQEEYTKLATKPEYNERCQDHKKSLINLKSYIEDRLDNVNNMRTQIGFVNISENEILWNLKNNLLLSESTQLKIDIKELIKMIEGYK